MKLPTAPAVTMTEEVLVALVMVPFPLIDHEYTSVPPAGVTVEV